MAEAVDHGGGQQHADDAQDGHHGEDEELGGLRLAVLGGDLVDLAPLWGSERAGGEGVNGMFPVSASGSLCGSIGRSAALSWAR